MMVVTVMMVMMVMEGTVTAFEKRVLRKRILLTIITVYSYLFCSLCSLVDTGSSSVQTPMRMICPCVRHIRD